MINHVKFCISIFKPGNAPQTTNDNISVSNPFEDPVASRPPYQQQQHTGAPQYPRPQGIFSLSHSLSRYLLSLSLVILILFLN